MTVVTALVALVALGVLTAGCGGTSSAGQRLSLVAYSTPQEAYGEVIAGFGRTPTGAGTSVTQSYGASGDQARSVIAGLPADVVALSLAPDIAKLVERGLVAEDWNADRYGGFVTKSVVVLAVREGNPENITTWDDLIEPGVEVIEPNPFTSGGARWNVMAAYGAQLEQGKTHRQAVDYLERLFENVAVQDKSAREALQTFTGGKGDVLIAYENEAITAQHKGEDIDYVVPDQTILIENPIAVVKKSRNPAEAADFIAYARSAAAQKVFAAHGYRPVLDSQTDPKRYPTPPGLFTIERLGGWSKVTDEFFEPEKGIVAEIERGLGVSTG